MNSNIRLALTLSALALAGAASPRAQISGIGPTGPVVKLADWLRFTEGPAATRDGARVFFSDLGTNTVYSMDLSGHA